MTSERRLRAWLRIAMIRSIGPATWNRWLLELEADGVSVEDFLDLPEYRQRPFFRNWPQVAEALRSRGPTAEQLDRTCAAFEREGIRLLPVFDPHYPGRILRDLGLDAPTFLSVAGKLTLLRAATVAMVGSLDPSPSGEETARAYAAALAREGIHVVSGQARGIDTASHEGALEAGGSTTMVLPVGILNFRPADSLRRLMTPDNALVVSQFAPQAGGDRRQPVLRNSVVAALADGLIVVEAGLIGGTAYAFREARRRAKPLWSVIYPEPVPPSAAGNHSLLSAGAKPLEPGAAAAEQTAREIAQTLRKAHTAETLNEISWPPPESPGQGELF